MLGIIVRHVKVIHSDGLVAYRTRMSLEVEYTRRAFILLLARLTKKATV